MARPSSTGTTAATEPRAKAHRNPSAPKWIGTKRALKEKPRRGSTQQADAQRPIVQMRRPLKTSSSTAGHSHSGSSSSQPRKPTWDDNSQTDDEEKEEAQQQRRHKRRRLAASGSNFSTGQSSNRVIVLEQLREESGRLTGATTLMELVLDSRSPWVDMSDEVLREIGIRSGALRPVHQQEHWTFELGNEHSLAEYWDAQAYVLSGVRVVEDSVDGNGSTRFPDSHERTSDPSSGRSLGTPFAHTDDDARTLSKMLVQRLSAMARGLRDN